MNIRELKPGKELDMLFAVKVMGWEYKFDNEKGLMAWFSGSKFMGNCFNPSTDISAAWEAINELNDMNRFFEISQWFGEELWVRVWTGSGVLKASIRIKNTISFPEGICKAALIALEDKS